jgi:hypothetical protein
MDFIRLQPGKDESFQNKFEDFYRTMLPVFQLKAKSFEAKSWIKELEEPDLTDGKNVI